MLNKKLSAFVGMIRLPNLGIIILTQVLLRYNIVKPVLYFRNPELISGSFEFFLLVMATLLIAMGGYLINDYFDASIDEINKPGKNVIGKEIEEKTVLKIYWFINGIATLIGFYLAYRVQSLSFGLIFPFIGMLLWFYSARYKRTFILGNFIVAALSTLVIFIVWYFEFLYLRSNPESFVTVLDQLKITTKLFLVYGLFAFLVSFLREIIKDSEDIRGDKENGCNTVPVKLGVSKTKVIIAILGMIVFLLVIYCGWFAYNMGEKVVGLYMVGVVGFPLIYMLVKLISAGKDEDFHFLSSLCKVVMVAGILAMQLFSVVN